MDIAVNRKILNNSLDIFIIRNDSVNKKGPMLSAPCKFYFYKNLRRFPYSHLTPSDQSRRSEGQQQQSQNQKAPFGKRGDRLAGRSRRDDILPCTCIRLRKGSERHIVTRGRSCAIVTGQRLKPGNQINSTRTDRPAGRFPTVAYQLPSQRLDNAKTGIIE